MKPTMCEMKMTQIKHCRVRCEWTWKYSNRNYPKWNTQRNNFTTTTTKKLKRALVMCGTPSRSTINTYLEFPRRQRGTDRKSISRSDGKIFPKLMQTAHPQIQEVHEWTSSPRHVKATMPSGRQHYQAIPYQVHHNQIASNLQQTKQS